MENNVFILLGRAVSEVQNVVRILVEIQKGVQLRTFLLFRKLIFIPIYMDT